MYCPNCDAQVALDATSCEVCGADFGASSSWRPDSSSRRTPPKTPIFSGKPKLIHAAQSIGFFVILGPLLGLLMTASASDSRESLTFALHPFAIVGAFAVGGAPAVVAGLLYCISVLCLVAAFPRMTLGAVAGAAIGVVVGYGAAAAYFPVLLSGNPNRVVRIVEMANLSAGAGLICGLVSGWLLPVGRSGTSTSFGSLRLRALAWLRQR